MECKTFKGYSTTTISEAIDQADEELQKYIREVDRAAKPNNITFTIIPIPMQNNNTGYMAVYVLLHE